jgi:hypothetical protein
MHRQSHGAHWAHWSLAGVNAMWCRLTRLSPSPCVCANPQTHLFCPRCGARTIPTESGSRRRCLGTGPGTALHKQYPRTGGQLCPASPAARLPTCPWLPEHCMADTAEAHGNPGPPTGLLHALFCDVGPPGDAMWAVRPNWHQHIQSTHCIDRGLKSTRLLGFRMSQDWLCEC